jgi:hypothetical protein
VSSGRPSVAGLPAVQELDEKITPLAAVAVVRALDADGHVRHYRLYTEGVTAVDAIGMHEAAAHMHKQALSGDRP